jgi:hypothetical protein
MAPLAPFRRLHGLIAPVVLTPLLLTVTTGMGYRLLKDWAGLSRDQVHVLMVLHEGEWLGSPLQSVYVLLNGLGLLWMLATGAGMLLQKWRRPAAKPVPTATAGPPSGATPGVEP